MDEFRSQLHKPRIKKLFEFHKPWLHAVFSFYAKTDTLESK